MPLQPPAPQTPLDYTSSAQPPLEPEIPTPWFKKKKIIIPVLILIGLIIVGLVLSFALYKPCDKCLDKQLVRLNQIQHQTAVESEDKEPEAIINQDTDTSTWQTYRNEEYGYEIKYPAGWRIQENKNFINNIGPGFEQNQYQLVTDSNHEINFYFRKYDLPADKDFLNWFESNSAKYGYDQVEYFSNNTLQGYRHTTEGNMSFKAATLNKEFTIIQLVFDLYYDEEYGYFFEPIVSTFKFLDQDIDIFNWQTYRNEEYGFEFKYPNDWQVEGESANPLYMCCSSEECKNLQEMHRCFIVEIKDISVQKFIDEYNSGTGTEQIVSGPTEYLLNGQPATKLVGSTSLGLDSSFVVFNKNNTSYIVDYYDFDEIHTKILSTFKFIDVDE